MADQNNEINDLTTAPAAKVPKTRSHGLLGYLTLLGVLVLAIGGYFLLQQLRSTQEGLGGTLDKSDKRILQLGEQITDLQSEYATLHQQLATVQTQMATEESKFERSLTEEQTRINDKIDVTKSDLEQSIQVIQRQLSRTRGDILLADAEYLLSAASQKLYLTGDVKAVLAALEAADQRLLESGDPAVFKVREALVEEVQALKKITPPDIIGVASQLLVLEGKAASLQPFLPHMGKTDPAVTAQKPIENAVTEDEKKGMLGEALDDIKDLVTVRHMDKPANVILYPEQVEALRQVLILKLEMTRFALLRNDNSLYKANLATVAEWLQQNFDTQLPQTREVLDQIKSLQDSPIQIQYPEIGKSLNLLRNIERLRLETEKAAPQGKSTPAGTDKAQEVKP